METFNANEFARQCYLRSEPSVDLNTIEAPIDCRDYSLKMSEYDKILKEFDVKPETELMFQCNIWVLNSGPKLVEG